MSVIDQRKPLDSCALPTGSLSCLLHDNAQPCSSELPLCALTVARDESTLIYCGLKPMLLSSSIHAMYRAPTKA